MSAVRIECPLSVCDWVLDATPPEVPATVLASVFGPGVMTATSAFTHSIDVERRLRDHFGTHKLEDWVAEITRLRDQLNAVAAHCRTAVHNASLVAMQRTDARVSAMTILALIRESGEPS